MAIINQHGELISQPWQTLINAQEISTYSHWIINLTQWQQSKDFLMAQRKHLALSLDNDIAVNIIADSVNYFELIILHFPKFTDGRAYSQARQLRDVLHYTGELQATGDVLRDQLWFMARCGFTRFEVRADQDHLLCAAAFGEISVQYSF
jgi:uncharacterized protein (DUF934 family)